MGEVEYSVQSGAVQLLLMVRALIQYKDAILPV